MIFSIRTEVMNTREDIDKKYTFKATEIEHEKEEPDYIPPKQTADTLFNFMKERQFLEQTIKNKKISARYCKENVEYLDLGISEMAFPMKCFCDINMHKLGEHLYWYGYYGIAFSKKWGMKQGIQPLQYIKQQKGLSKNFGFDFINA